MNAENLEVRDNAAIDDAVEAVLAEVARQIDVTLVQNNKFMRRLVTFAGIFCFFVGLATAALVIYAKGDFAKLGYVDYVFITGALGVFWYVSFWLLQHARQLKGQGVDYERRRGLCYAVSSAFDEKLTSALQVSAVDSITAGVLVRLRDQFGYIPYAYWCRVVELRISQGTEIPKHLAVYGRNGL